MQRQTTLLFVIMITCCGLLQATQVFHIHKTSWHPFQVSGERTLDAWYRADMALGLVNPQTAGIEAFSTRTQALYDNLNLYVSMRCFFNPAFRSDRTIQHTPKQDNFVTVCLKGTGSPAYQIMVSEGGQMKASLSNGNAVKLPGIRKSILVKPSHWIANITIPLSAVGLQPKPQTLRFNVTRQTIDLPQNKSQLSSFLVETQDTRLDNPQLWPQVEMTEDPGNGKWVYADSDRVRFNLIGDPNFDFISHPSKNPHIQRVEISSGQWLLRVTGKVYQFHSIYLENIIKHEHPYILRVRARKIGQGKAAFGCLQLRKDEKGKYREGKRPGWDLVLGKDFKNYDMKFKGDKGTLSLFFYKLGKHDDASGIEIAEISLFNGHEPLK